MEEIKDQEASQEEDPKKVTRKKKSDSPAVTQKKKSSGFDLLDGDSNYIEKMQETLSVKSKQTSGFKTAGEIHRDVIPWPHLALQYLTQNRGIMCRTITEILGKDKLGKTALLFWIMGNCVRNNIPCGFINTEMKYPHKKWLKRIVSSNPTMSEKILARGIGVYDAVRSLDQMDRCVREFAYYIRSSTENPVPLSVPILICVDCISKLASPEEIEAFCPTSEPKETATKAKKDATKEDPSDSKAKKQAGLGKAVKLTSSTISEGALRRATHASWMAKWMRVLKGWVDDYNIALIMTSAQNDNMKEGTFSAALPEDWKSLRNRTKLGGNASNQSAAYQLILAAAPSFEYKVDKTAVGINIKARTEKNSYGGGGREIQYQIRTADFPLDTEDYLQPAIEMDDAFCKVLVLNKIMGIKLDKGLYNWRSHGIVEGSAEDVMRVINADEDLKNDICVKLGIEGYENRV